MKAAANEMLAAKGAQLSFWTGRLGDDVERAGASDHYAKSQACRLDRY